MGVLHVGGGRLSFECQRGIWDRIPRLGGPGKSLELEVVDDDGVGRWNGVGLGVGLFLEERRSRMRDS